MSSHNKPSRIGLNFVPRMEKLEDRTVPAGNVQAVVFDGTLYVSGDEAGNQIWIAGTGRESVMIRSLDGSTTINGQTGPVHVKGIERDIYIRLFGGDDNLLVTGTRNRGTLDVDLGAGNDILGISDAGHRQQSILRTGDGNDTAILNGSAFRRYLFLDTGTGDDQVVAQNIGVVDFGLENPGGNDFFDNRNSTIMRPAVTGFSSGMRPATAPETEADTTAPTVTLSTTATTNTNTAPIVFAANFSEDVTGFSGSNITVANGSVTSFTQLDAQTYSFSVTPTAQGVVSATVLANSVQDAAGNGNIVSNTVMRTFDSVSPTVGINAQTTSDTTPTITGTVNEANSTVRVTVNNVTYNATVTGTTWSANVTNPLPDGTFSVTATATDAAGNVGTATIATALRVDATPPTVTFSTNPSAPTNESFVTLTVTFNEDVTDLMDSDIVIGNATKSNFTMVNARTYTVDLAPLLEGNVTVSVAAGAARDAANNASEAASFNILYDITPPTATINTTGTGTITGTSSDTSAGVANVSISIQDVNDTNLYWTGTAFENAGETFLTTATTDSFATWSFTLPRTGSFLVRARATDTAGNQFFVSETVVLN